METAFALFDRLLFGRILRLPKDADIASIDLAAHDEKNEEQRRYRDFIYGMMSGIDTKIAALLTHISLIIAALVFIYSSRAVASASVLLKNMILFEIVAYLTLTVFCLRCIRMSLSLSTGGAAAESEVLAIEFYKRRVTYIWASNMTVYVTIATIVTLVLGAIFGL